MLYIPLCETSMASFYYPLLIILSLSGAAVIEGIVNKLPINAGYCQHFQQRFNIP